MNKLKSKYIAVSLKQSLIHWSKDNNQKTLEDHREKMNINAKICMSKIMHTPIKVGICMYATYANCQTCHYKIYVWRWYDPSLHNLVFSDKKKYQIPNILPMWAFVPLKCQQNFEILQLVWILAPNDRHFSKHFGLPPFIKWRLSLVLT